MARRFSRSRFVRPAPRTKMWIGAGVGETTITASAVQLISSLSAGALLLRPFTILRTRMVFHWESDQTSTTERPRLYVGQIVVTDSAVGSGAAAIPDPSGEDGNPEADWFVFQPMFSPFVLLTAAGWNDPRGTQYIVDSKAMRKVGPDDDIAMMSSETGAKGGILTSGGRRLIQLH